VDKQKHTAEKNQVTAYTICT